jgi:hypothetical protein
MKWLIALAMISMALVAARAEGQPRPPAAVDRSPIRVQSGGNELVALRQAPVAYTTLEQLVADVGRPAANRRAPIRVVRAAPQQTVDYVLCVTSGGTLVVGERVHTFDVGQRRYVFTRGEMSRSYPPLDVPDGWLWLVEIPVSRETSVTFELRARGRWPVEVITVTSDQVR